MADILDKLVGDRRLTFTGVLTLLTSRSIECNENILHRISISEPFNTIRFYISGLHAHFEAILDICSKSYQNTSLQRF